MPGSHSPSKGPLVAHVDGGSRGNPGPSGWGVFLPADGSRPALGAWGFLAEATNNVAEYSALVAGLEWCSQNGVKELLVRSDSDLLIKQMNGQYRVKNATLQKLHKRARDLAKNFDVITYEHVRREYNKDADRLANLGVDEWLAAEGREHTPRGPDPVLFD